MVKDVFSKGVKTHVADSRVKRGVKERSGGDSLLETCRVLLKERSFNVLATCILLTSRGIIEGGCDNLCKPKALGRLGCPRNASIVETLTFTCDTLLKLCGKGRVGFGGMGSGELLVKGVPAMPRLCL